MNRSYSKVENRRRESCKRECTHDQKKCGHPIAIFLMGYLCGYGNCEKHKPYNVPLDQRGVGHRDGYQQINGGDQ